MDFTRKVLNCYQNNSYLKEVTDSSEEIEQKQVEKPNKFRYKSNRTRPNLFLSKKETRNETFQKFEHIKRC